MLGGGEPCALVPISLPIASSTCGFALLQTFEGGNGCGLRGQRAWWCDAGREQGI